MNTNTYDTAKLLHWLTEQKNEALRVRDACCMTNVVAARNYYYHDGKVAAYARVIVEVHEMLERMQQEQGGG